MGSLSPLGGMRPTENHCGHMGSRLQPSRKRSAHRPLPFANWIVLRFPVGPLYGLNTLFDLSEFVIRQYWITGAYHFGFLAETSLRFCRSARAWSPSSPCGYPIHRQFIWTFRFPCLASDGLSDTPVTYESPLEGVLRPPYGER